MMYCRFRTASIMALFVLGLVPAFPAFAETGSSDFARISHLSGTLQAKGGYDDDWVAVDVNVPIGSGDSLWLNEGGLAEVEFPGGSRIRMRGEAKLDLNEFNVDPGSFLISLEVVAGSLYVRTPRRPESGPSEPVVLTVPAARLSIGPESLVRLDIEPGRARVRVREGSVRIYPFDPGEPDSIILGRMEQIRLESNAEPGFPGYFSRISEDGLERYNRYRDERFYRDGSDDRLDQTLVGEDELDRYGKWVLIGGINYWRPYVSIGWRPYSVGHWAWYNGAGWMWISGDPFGYVTFHYGRWHYDGYYGWIWHPGYVFAPAYVHWISIGPYYAWAPLGPYGYPVTTGSIHLTFYTGFGIDLHVWSYAHVDYFIGIRHHHHHPRQHVHFRNPDRRHFTEHRGRVVQAGTVGGSPSRLERTRQPGRADGRQWEPYPNLPRQERTEGRTFRSTSKIDSDQKTSRTEDRRSPGPPTGSSRWGKSSQDSHLDALKTDRSTARNKESTSKSEGRELSRKTITAPKPPSGPAAQIHRAPAVKQREAPPRVADRKQGEIKGEGPAAKKQRGVVQKDGSPEYIGKGFRQGGTARKEPFKMNPPGR